MEKLVKALRAAGVSYFKSEDVEIRFGAVESQTIVNTRGPVVPENVPRRTRQKDKTPEDIARISSPNNVNAGDVPIKEMNVPHQLNQMASVMKMGDEQLVDLVFPIDVSPSEILGGM